MKKLTAIIEKSKSGHYGIYVDELDGITGDGETIEEAKEDLKMAIQEVVAYCRDNGIDTGDLGDGVFEFVYKYNI